MNNKPATPVSVISDVQHLAQALYHDRIDIISSHDEIDSFSNGAGVSASIYSPVRKWAEIGGITNQRAAAILKDFLDEFAVITAERDRLHLTLRQIAETAIKVGDV
jgi:hypothetical protein